MQLELWEAPLRLVSTQLCQLHCQASFYNLGLIAVETSFLAEPLGWNPSSGIPRNAGENRDLIPGGTPRVESLAMLERAEAMWIYVSCRGSGGARTENPTITRRTLYSLHHVGSTYI